MNVISLEHSKDVWKGKMFEADTMPVKRARREEVEEGDAEDQGRNRAKGEGEKSKRRGKPRRQIGIEDFLLGRSSEPYDLIEDVSSQGPKITWPQLLHLAPKVRRQWTKMVSTRKGKIKAMNLIAHKGTTKVAGA